MWPSMNVDGYMLIATLYIMKNNDLYNRDVFVSESALFIKPNYLQNDEI